MASWGALLKRHAELLFVVTLLVIAALGFHWLPYKLAFLNFFYLPVLAAGYLLSTRRAVLSGVLCVLLVVLYYLWLWMGYALISASGLAALTTVIVQQIETVLSLAVWGGFLILTAAVFGRAQERMLTSHAKVRGLAEELQQRSGLLEESNRALLESTATLQRKAEELESQNLLVERLRQQVEQTLYSTMDATVARLIIQGRLRQEKRSISVLFCDLKGFTGLEGQKHPEVILETLNQFYQDMEEVIEDYHGHIDKYMGDGILCEFGAPIDYEHHALQAVLTGLKMQEKFRSRQNAYGLRVGIATGDAIVGLLGARRRSYSAIGEVVNLGKRLEQLCEPGCVFIDETTQEAVAAFVETEQVRSLTGRRAQDKTVRDEVAEKEAELRHDPHNADLLFAVGNLHFRLQEATKAMLYYRRAMALRPDDNAIKVAYADASVKRDEFERLNIRGLQQRQAVYRATGQVDPLKSRERFPASFYEQYKHVPELMEIPDAVVLPTECIDSTVGHSLVVATLAYAIADRMGLPEPLKRHLLTAARLQDVGKSTVWHHILTRRGGLSEQERKSLEAHVTESVSNARRLGYDTDAVLSIIANHHELLSGGGYPRRVKGPDIPIGARISTVADLFSALTASRPYRPAWDAQVALKELRKQAAEGQLDGTVVDTACSLLLAAQS
jgi:HD-GYP domain-containing protein (c-di-GMP phosphodiesterase class II)